MPALAPRTRRRRLEPAQLKHGGAYLDAAYCGDTMSLNPGSSYEGGACQLWRFVPVGGGWGRLQLKHGCAFSTPIIAACAHLEPGSDYDGGSCQLWRLIAAGRAPHRSTLRPRLHSVASCHGLCARLAATRRARSAGCRRGRERLDRRLGLGERPPVERMLALLGERGRSTLHLDASGLASLRYDVTLGATRTGWLAIGMHTLRLADITGVYLRPGELREHDQAVARRRLGEGGHGVDPDELAVLAETMRSAACALLAASASRPSARRALEASEVMGLLRLAVRSGTLRRRS